MSKNEIKEVEQKFDGEYTPDSLVSYKFNDTEVIATESVDDGIPTIGSLMTYSVSDMLVPTDFVKDAWEKLNIPEFYKPSEPSKTNAFLGACSRFENEINKSQSDFLVNDKRYKCEWKFRKLNSTTKVVSRHIYVVGSGTKKDKQTIEHINVCKVEFNPDDETVSFIQMDGETNVCNNVRNSIEKQYEIVKDCIDSQRFRNMIRKAFKNYDGCPFAIGKGGAWFVPSHKDSDGNEETTDLFGKFRAFFRQANDKYAVNDNSAFFTDIRTIPVLAREQLRQDIATDITNEVEKQFTRLLKKTEEMLSDENKNYNSIDDDKAYNQMLKSMENLKEIKDYKEKYEQLLSMNINVEKFDQGLPLINVNGDKVPIGGRVKSLYRELINFTTSEEYAETLVDNTIENSIKSRKIKNFDDDDLFDFDDDENDDE